MNRYPDRANMDAQYLSDEWMETVAKANDVTQLPYWMTETFPKIVDQIGYGSTKKYEGVDDFGRLVTVILYSTGGWSGQESFMEAIQRNMVWMLYAYSWHRGGHYEFRVPRKEHL